MTSRPPWYAGQDEDQIAAALVAAGVPPTQEAILAALRAPKAPDLDRELARGYVSACARWGAPIGHYDEIEEFGRAPETVRPGR